MSEDRGRVLAPQPRRAEDANGWEVAKVTAAAFHDDPVTRWLFPDADQRRELLPRCFTLDVRLGIEQGLVDTVDDLAAAAVWWRAPLGTGAAAEEAFSAYVDEYVAIAEEAGPDAGERTAAVFDLLADETPSEPHLSLELIGTRPGRQGNGLGALVLRPGLQRCDEEGLPAHLWSSNPRNLSFYLRHGFTLLRETRIADGPPVWLMQRPPQPGAPSIAYA